MKPTSSQNGKSFAAYLYYNTSHKLTYSDRLLKSIICSVLKTFLQCDNIKYYSCAITVYEPILVLSVYSPYLQVEVFLNQNNLAVPNLSC